MTRLQLIAAAEYYYRAAEMLITKLDEKSSTQRMFDVLEASLLNHHAGALLAARDVTSEEK